MHRPLPESLGPSDLRRIVDSLERRECNLLLGSEVDVLGEDGKPHNLAAELGRTLAERLNLQVDGRPALPSVAQEFQERMGKEGLMDQVAAFLRDYPVALTSDSVFATLAKLPFRIVVSSRHDHTLDDYLRAEGKEPFVRSWDIRRSLVDTLPEDEEISAQRPLVFYLCGEVENPDSLIVSEDDVIELVRQLARRNPGVPYYLQTKMQENRSLLVGFGVPKWYTRVILEELGKVSDKEKSSFAFGEFEVFERPGAEEDRRSRARAADVEAVRFHMSRFNIKTVIGDTEKNLEDVLEAWQERAGTLEAETEGEAQIDRTRPYVFLSYCGEDVKHAEDLYEVLTAKGIQCFWDKKGIRAGQAWMSRLTEEMDRVTAFVLLVSENLSDRARLGSVVFEEAWMARDVARRKNLEQFLLPVFVDGRREPFNLANDPSRTYGGLNHARVTTPEQREAFADLVLETHIKRVGEGA